MRSSSAASSRMNTRSRGRERHKPHVATAARRRQPTHCPTRSRGRATGAAARSSRACAEAPACRPRSDTPSPRGARSGGDPTPRGRTAPESERRLVARCAAGAPRPARYPVDAIDARVREPRSRPLQRAPQLARPLRHAVAQAAHEPRQARARQRRVHARRRRRRARRCARDVPAASAGPGACACAA